MVNFPEPGIEHERPQDDLDQFSYTNWMKIHSHQREVILAHIRGKVDVSMLNTWRDQHARGMKIGSDNVLFHMWPGMQIRNTCRDILQDDLLPSVKYEDGHEYQNWDDFYGGMLQELVKNNG